MDLKVIDSNGYVIAGGILGDFLYQHIHLRCGYGL